MTQRNWLTFGDLQHEWRLWPETDRNDQGLRFGQYLYAKYEGLPSSVFFTESKNMAYDRLVDYLTDVQR